jgi:hypothetical protein
MPPSAAPTKRQITLRGAAIAVLSAVFVVGYWAMKDFRLRVIGDAGESTQACAALAQTNPLKILFQVTYCGVLSVASVRTWLIIQIVLWGVAVALVYRAGANLFDEPTGVIAGLATASLWETFRFAVRPQSDLILLFAVTVAFWALSRCVRFGTRRSWLLVAGSLVFVGFSKPLGFPLVFGWVVWTMLPLDSESSRSLRLDSLRTVALSVSGALFSLYVILTYLVPRLSGPAPTPDLYWRRGLAGSWVNGIIATHPRETTMAYAFQPRGAETMVSWVLVNLDHVAVMGLLRAAFFFVPVLPRWDTFHVVVNAVTILPLVVGTVLGARLLLRRDRYSVAGLLLAPILTSLLTVAIVYVDGGFNYRAPATLAFALLSAYWLRQLIADTVVERRIRVLLPAALGGDGVTPDSRSETA